MTEDEFQKAVLSELKDVKASQHRFEAELQNVKVELRSVNDTVVSLDQKVEKLAADQQGDVIGMLQILNEKVATKEDILSVSGIIKILSTRSIQHEAEIERIKQVLK